MKPASLTLRIDTKEIKSEIEKRLAALLGKPRGPVRPVSLFNPPKHTGGLTEWKRD